MTNLERARKWLEDTLVKQVGQKRNLAWIEEQEVALTALLDEANVDQIAAWLHGLEDRLYEEIKRTNDPHLFARRGIYEGIASEVVGRNWQTARLDAWQKVSAAERVDILRKKIVHVK